MVMIIKLKYPGTYHCITSLSRPGRTHFLEVIRGERFDTEAKLRRAGEKTRQRGLLMSLRFQGAIFPHLLGEKTKRNGILGHRASVKRCSVTHFPQTGNGAHSLSMYVII